MTRSVRSCSIISMIQFGTNGPNDAKNRCSQNDKNHWGNPQSAACGRVTFGKKKIRFDNCGVRSTDVNEEQICGYLFKHPMKRGNWLPQSVWSEKQSQQTEFWAIKSAQKRPIVDEKSISHADVWCHFRRSFTQNNSLTFHRQPPHSK